MKYKKLLFLLSWAILSFNLYALDRREKQYLIYQPEKAKANDYYVPFDYYFNTAFDVNQNPYYFNQKHYWSNHQVVWQRIKNPDKSIRKDGGYKKMFKDEFFSSRVVPNLFLHTLGGGYDFLKLKEWYDYHGFPMPTLFAITTSYAAHMGNEALEASDPNLISHDHIVDLFFFDAVGKFLFSNKSAAQFFYQELGMRNWTFVPMYDPHHSKVWNTGTNYIFRPKKLARDHISPFALAGMQALFGVSLSLDMKRYLTLSMGPAMTDPLKGKSKLAIGIFYDNDGDLMASFLINSTEEFRYRLNLYPSFFNYDRLSIGTVLGIDRGDQFALGVNINMPIGLGQTL